jgi:hypothetical protein
LASSDATLFDESASSIKTTLILLLDKCSILEALKTSSSLDKRYPVLLCDIILGQVEKRITLRVNGKIER